MRVQDNVAIVTGGARGIGLAIAQTLIAEGGSVMLADLDEGAATQAADKLAASAPDRVAAVKADVSSKADCQHMFDATVERFGRVDSLICNAGIVRPGKPIEEISEDAWQQIIGVNLMGCVYPTQIFAPMTKTQGSGRIVYMASVAGEVGGVSAEMTYSVTKAGILCLTKAVAKQLASHGVTVNAVAPGAIQTDMTDVLQYDDSVKQSIPLGHYGEVDDIAKAVLYLVSDDARYITGTTIDVNGGMYIR